MKAFFAAVATAVLCVGIGFATPAAADVNDVSGAAPSASPSTPLLLWLARSRLGRYRVSTFREAAGT
jgi:hypothetical protein